MTVFFSGCDRPKFLKIITEEGGRPMISPPHVVNNKLVNRWLNEHPGVATLDSGAFQGNTNIEKYCDLIEQYGNLFYWVANLDVINDPVGSQKNYDYLMENLPKAIAKKVLWVYQGGLPDRLPPLIGIGGLVPLAKRPLAIQEKLAEIGSLLTGSKTKCHVFGVANLSLLAWLYCQSWFESVDSSTWLCGIKSNEILTQNGRMQCEKYGILLTPEERARASIRTLLTISSSNSYQVSLVI